MIQKYELIEEIWYQLDPKPPIGTIVYPLAYCDYGLARDDTMMTGMEHISVTLDPDGNYPSFTVPIKSLKAL